MDLKTDNIHEYTIKCSNMVQITLDDDFNVQDQKADIENCVKDWGEVVVNSVKVNSDKAQIDGELTFGVLYIGKGSGMMRFPVKMSGKMPFTEMINLSEDATDDYVSCKASIEDLSIKPVNSRKISVKAIINLEVICENVKDICLLTDIEGDEPMAVSKEELEFVQLVINQRDNFRIKENCVLPPGRPEIKEIVWEDVDVRCLNSRLTDSGLKIKGEINVFVMYISSDENQMIQWYETSIPFEGDIELSGCSQDMIPYVSFTTVSKSVEPREDMDGENREFSVELMLDLDVKAYEERRKCVIRDAYLPKRDIELVRNNLFLKRLLIRNNSSLRVSSVIKVEDFVNLLQICNCTANLWLDDYELEDSVIKANGAVSVNVFYISSNDGQPMGSVKTVIPFSANIDIPKCPENCNIDFKLNPSLESLQANINSSGIIEVKAGIALDAICFDCFTYSSIDSIEVKEGECQSYKEMPSMVGVICDGSESLWDVAKHYNTTVDNLRRNNTEKLKSCSSDSEKLQKGTKLLVVKQR